MVVMRVISCAVLCTLLFGCAAAVQQQEQKERQAAVHYKLGVSYMQSNNPSLALKELLKASEISPSDSAIHVALAQSYQQKKAYTEAERHYLRALELSNNDPRYQNNIATLYLDTEQWDKAISYFDKASSNLLFLNPHIALCGKGYALFRKGDPNGALEAFKESQLVAPGYAPAFYLESEVHEAQGDLLKARAALESAVDTAPNYTQAHYQLGMLLLKSKEEALAARHFKRVVEQTPDTELGRKASKLLATLPKP